MNKLEQPIGRHVDIGFAKLEEPFANEVMQELTKHLPKEWGITQHGAYLTVRFYYRGFQQTVTMMVTDMSFFDHSYTGK